MGGMGGGVRGVRWGWEVGCRGGKVGKARGGGGRCAWGGGGGGGGGQNEAEGEGGLDVAVGVAVRAVAVGVGVVGENGRRLGGTCHIL